MTHGSVVRRFRWSNPSRMLLAAAAAVGIAALALSGAGSAANPDPRGIQVCHEPAGRSPHVVEVGGEAALLAHLRHGDRLFGSGLAPDCSGGAVRLVLDPTLAGVGDEIEGLDGGPSRPVAAAVGPDGIVDAFVVDEVQYRPESEAALQSFLARYGAIIVRDDTVLVSDENGVLSEIPGGADGWHLLRFTSAASPLSDLPELLGGAGLSGEYAFSSEAALRAVALQLRERDLALSLNFVMQPAAIPEHPDGMGGYIDFEPLWWMAQPGEANPGGTATVRAWQYLRHTGLPPVNGVWRPARVAIVDGGFNLDPVTGLGSRDYVNNHLKPPQQVDTIDWDGTAGGESGWGAGYEWHGELVFSSCCAYPRNTFGAAGAGGEYVRPIPIRTGSSLWEVANGIRSAAFMFADVVVTSLSKDCGFACRAGDSLTDSDLQNAIYDAIVLGPGVVFAVAENDGVDIGGGHAYPCQLDKVICVGGANASNENVYNYGAGVDIWGPWEVLATVIPTTADDDADDVGEDELALAEGTSFSAPFVAGVAALLKTHDASLRWDEIQQILLDTATPSDDPKIPPGTGMVNALAAVQAVRENPPPIPQFLVPDDGETLPWSSVYSVGARVDDPPAPLGFNGEVIFSSDRDGELCRAAGNLTFLSCVPSFSTLGTHQLTATAIDEFGATAEDSITLTITNQAPTIAITSPGDGSTHASDQRIPLRANASDPNETIAVDDISWESSLDGALSPTSDRTVTLSVGEHVLTATATDSFGATGTDSVEVTIVLGSGLPSAVILSPATNSSFRTGSTVRLEGSGWDPQDGSLDGDSLEWFSDRDGFLGTGSVVEIELSGADCEDFVRHVITLRATDSDGNVDEETVVIFIGQIC